MPILRVFYRYMSTSEAKAVRETGLLRGGRPGPTFWTDKLYTSASEAKSLLALPMLPEVRMEFRIMNEPTLVAENSIVDPAAEEPGGGIEWMTKESVEVEVIKVDRID